MEVITDGAGLRKERLARRMSLRALGERVGLSEGALSDYERGAKRIPQHAGIALVAVLAAVPVVDAENLPRDMRVGNGRPRNKEGR